MGWGQFEFSIIEICSLDMQQERENYYLQKYLPLLNTIFKSYLGDIQSYDSLYEYLNLRQTELNLQNKHKGVNIYLYRYINGQISSDYTTFSSINLLSKYLGIGRETISIYLNTYIPYKGNLFLTDIVEYTDVLEKLISDAIQGLDLDRSIAKKVWIYSIDEHDAVNKFIFDSKGAAAKA